MRAVIVGELSDADQLQTVETADPRPEAGQRLIATKACDVRFLDAMLRGGMAPSEMTPELPWIPGNGGGARVVAVGEGVRKEWVGRLVGAHTGNRGGYADLPAVRVDDAESRPAAQRMAAAAFLGSRKNPIVPAPARAVPLRSPSGGNE
jgi:NADPH2:quinone reductase